MKFFFSVLLFAQTAFVSAQTIDLSTPAKLPVKTNKFKVIGKNNDGIMVRMYGTEDIINTYGDDLKLSSSKPIAFKNQSGLLQHIVLNKTGSVIFYLMQDKKYSVLYAQPVSAKFIEIGKPLAIDTLYDRRDMIASNLRFKSSLDQNNLLIYYPFFSGSTIQNIKFICLNHALTTIYNKTVPIGRNEKELEESKALLDNNGNAMLLLKPEAKDNDRFDVFRVSNTGQLSTYSITSTKALFSDPYFDVDNKNGNLLMCAFYDDSKQTEAETANGFLYAAYNPATGAVIQYQQTLFPKPFIIDLTGREPNGQAKLYTFNIKKAMLRNDGGALIIAESLIKDTREAPAAIGIQPGFSSYRTTVTYQYNDIIAFSINPNGEMGWNSVMHKKQASEDDNGAYSSFSIMNEKDQLRLVYLDDISTSGILSEYLLTTEGKNTRRVLLNQEDKDLMLLPKMAKQVSPNELVVPSYKNGTLQLVKITY